MMKNMLEYKGYHTKIEFETDTLKLHGKIEGIRDFVNFESDDPSEIEKEFHDAVDDYIEFCKEVGKEPDKEYKGSFNVRISPELHREVATVAYKNGESLNQTVEKAIQSYVNGISTTNTQLQRTIAILTNVLETHGIYKMHENQKVNTRAEILPFSAKNIKITYINERVKV